MNPKVRPRAIAATLAILIPLHAGCAPVYLAGKTPPSLRPAQGHTLSEQAPRVAIRVGTPVVLQPLGTHYQPVTLGPLLRDAVQKVTGESAPFRALPVDPDPAKLAEADYVVDFQVSTRPDHGGVGRLLTIFGAALTLGVLPLHQPHHLVLTARVAGRGNQEPRTYRIEGSITEIIQTPLTLFLPLGWVLTPDRAVRTLLEDMTRALYERMRGDGLFAAS